MHRAAVVISVSMLSFAMVLLVSTSSKPLHAQAGNSGGRPAVSCPESLAKAIDGLKLCSTELRRCEARPSPVPGPVLGAPGGGLHHRNALQAVLEHPEELDFEEAAKLSLLSAKVLNSKARLLPKEKLSGIGKVLGQTREALRKVDASVAKRKTEDAR